MSSLIQRVHRLLLPDDPDIGWTPYLWLTYFVFFYIPYFLEPPSAGRLALILGGGAAFLFFYFLGYRVRGPAFLLCIFGITSIGLLLSPHNPLGATFFIYACAFAAQLEGRRRVAISLFLVCGSAVIEWWLLDMRGWFLVPVLVFGPMVALVNLHYARRYREQRELKLSHEEVRRLAATAERERIARDLHDLLGHSLSLITLKAELAGKLMGRDRDRAARELAELEHVSRAALKEVRSAVTGFRAADLASELANARLALEAAGVTFTCEGRIEGLPAEVDHTLAMCLREAVTNVIRHASASRCRVRIKATGGALVVSIRDDGGGRVAEEGSGLRGMRERVRAIGGELAVTEGRGIRLCLTVPLADLAGPALAERMA